MNMRKIIAVLAAALMLCTIIPMAAVSVSAADVTIPAASSWTASTDTATVAEDTDGTIKISYISNYGWAGFWANVEANTDYTLTYKIKGSKASRKTTTQIKDSGWNTIHSEAYTEGDLLLGTDWVERTTTFNSGETTSVLIYVQSGHSSAWDAWMDAISLTVAEGGSETIVDTFVHNGDFETGDLTGWKSGYNGVVQSDVVHGGSYAHKSTNTAAKYQGMMQQNPIAVKPNSDYTVTFWYYYEGNNATGSGASFYLYAQTTDNSANLKSITTYPSAANTWAQVTLSFNSGDNDEIALVWSNRMASDGGTYYFDDVVMSGPAPEGEAPAVPDNAIYFEDFEGDHTWKSNSTSSPESLVGAADLPVANATAQSLSLCQVVADGDYPYMSDRTGFTVTPNTDYVLSFEALNTTNNWPIQAIIAPNYWLGSAIFTTASQKVTPAAHSWETYTVTFNSGDNTTLYVGLKSQWANSTVYFDNVWIAPLDYTYANDGYLTDGDFEAGGMGWLHTDNTEIIADPTGAGQGNVMHVDENTGSAHMFSQIAENLIAGETYTLSFKVYGYASVTNSAFFLKFPSTCTNFSWGGDLVGYAYSTYVNRFNVNSNTGKWMTATVTFTTSDTAAVLNFQNYRGDAGQYYFDDIVLTHNHSYADATCTAPKTCVCGATEGDVAHGNIVHVEALEPTCTALGNIEYWYCETCGATWADEALTQVTNQMSVKLPMADHTYDNEFDADCNACGAVREVAACPITYIGKSVSEDVSGYAVLFNAAVEGIVVKEGTFVQADFTNATYNGYKLVGLGVKASNGTSETTIEGLRMYDLEEGNAKFAFRVINIPADKLDVEITMTPYYIVEIDGVETTIYGEAQVGSYAEIAG